MYIYLPNISRLWGTLGGSWNVKRPKVDFQRVWNDFSKMVMIFRVKGDEKRKALSIVGRREMRFLLKAPEWNSAYLSLIISRFIFVSQIHLYPDPQILPTFPIWVVDFATGVMGSGLIPCEGKRLRLKCLFGFLPLSLKLLHFPCLNLSSVIFRF